MSDRDTPTLALDGEVMIVAAGRPMRLVGHDDTLLLELERPAHAWWLWRHHRSLQLPGRSMLATWWRRGRLRLEIVCGGRTLAATGRGESTVRPRLAGVLAIVGDLLRGGR